VSRDKKITEKRTKEKKKKKQRESRAKFEEKNRKREKVYNPLSLRDKRQRENRAGTNSYRVVTK